MEAIGEIKSKVSDVLKWDIMLRLVNDLIEAKKYKLALLVAIPSYVGIRHSDTIRLRYNDLLLSEKLTLIETKTQKLKRVREIQINADLKKIVEICKQEHTGDEYIFANSRGCPETIQYHNQQFKKLRETYNYIDIQNFTQHSTRKCFAVRVYEKLGSDENALITLQYLLKHSSTAITLCYLGLQRKIEQNVYLNL
jgi:integrase